MKDSVIGTPENFPPAISRWIFVRGRPFVDRKVQMWSRGRACSISMMIDPALLTVRQSVRCIVVSLSTMLHRDSSTGVTCSSAELSVQTDRRRKVKFSPNCRTCDMASCWLIFSLQDISHTYLHVALGIVHGLRLYTITTRLVSLSQATLCR